MLHRCAPPAWTSRSKKCVEATTFLRITFTRKPEPYLNHRQRPDSVEFVRIAGFEKIQEALDVVDIVLDVELCVMLFDFARQPPAEKRTTLIQPVSQSRNPRRLRVIGTMVL